MPAPEGWVGDRGVDPEPCSRPVRSAYHSFIRDVVRATGALHGEAWRVDADEAHLHEVARLNLPPAPPALRVLPRSAPALAAECLRLRSPVQADHATAERRHPVSAPVLQQAGARSLVAVPVRGDRLHGILALGFPQATLPPRSLDDLARLCDNWSVVARAAEDEERLLEGEAWRAACVAASESIDAGLEQVVHVLADAARFLPRKGPIRQRSRSGADVDLPTPRDGLQPHRQAHLLATPAAGPAGGQRGAAVPFHSAMETPVLQGGLLTGHVQFARSKMMGCFTAQNLDWAQEFAKAVASTQPTEPQRD